MSAQLRYAYLKGHTWIYRRNYPRDVAVVLGAQALKQSLKTGDLVLARARAAEVNARYETMIAQVRSGAEEAANTPFGWEAPSTVLLARLRDTLEGSEPVAFLTPKPKPRVEVAKIGRHYLNLRSDQLRPSGFKSVRYSVGLFLSQFGTRTVEDLSRDDGRLFLDLIAQLAPLIGKSHRTRNKSLTALVDWSRMQGQTITVRTQKRIWSQVNSFMDWLVYEGHLDQNPFRSVRFDQKQRPSPYAVFTDDEVVGLMNVADPVLHPVLAICLLTGMRAGEAVGLMREDLINKGDLGWFIHVRPNARRLLKTESAERQVPMHRRLEPVFGGLPSKGPLFPQRSVNAVTKRFARARDALELDRPQVVFHSSRKWFITQCERTGVPEHFTASLVGHQSARSENKITYGIYSAGISDAQKRAIVDAINLPDGALP